MKKYDLRLDAANLHDDLTTIRRARGTKGPKGDEDFPCTVGKDEEWEIDLIWNGTDNEVHTLPVFVKGPALVVEGFLPKQGTRIDFFNGRGFNYNEEEGLKLEFWDIVSNALEKLEAGEYRLSGNGYRGARLAYVMCVFVASEIVRNEVLERIFATGTQEKWNEYMALYKNWASVSSTINGCESNEFAEVIYPFKVKSMLQFWENNPDIDPDNEKIKEVREQYSVLLNYWFSEEDFE